MIQMDGKPVCIIKIHAFRTKMVNTADNVFLVCLFRMKFTTNNWHILHFSFARTLMFIIFHLLTSVKYIKFMQFNGIQTPKIFFSGGGVD